MAASCSEMHLMIVLLLYACAVAVKLLNGAMIMAGRVIVEISNLL